MTHADQPPSLPFAWSPLQERATWWFQRMASRRALSGLGRAERPGQFSRICGHFVRFPEFLLICWNLGTIASSRTSEQLA